MDKRKAWREQEQRLVEALEPRRGALQAGQTRRSRPAGRGGGALSEDLMQKAQTARAEMEAVRRAVARVKVEFNSGKRY